METKFYTTVYDYIKQRAFDPHSIRTIIQNSNVHWTSEYDCATQKPKEFPRTGEWGEWTLYLKSPAFLEIAGSLHKYYHNGRNECRFSINETLHAIDRFCQDFAISPSMLFVCNLEFGVNLRPIIDASMLMEKIICFRNKMPWRPYQSISSAFIMQFEAAKYFLKIYDKGKQYHLSNLLRIEIKARRAQYLKFAGIKTLADLSRRDSVLALGQRLENEIKKIVFGNPDINRLRLSAKDEKIFDIMSNPLNWKNKSKTSNTSEWRKRNVFRQIIADYSDFNISKHISEITAEELAAMGLK